MNSFLLVIVLVVVFTGSSLTAAVPTVPAVAVACQPASSGALATGRPTVRSVQDGRNRGDAAQTGQLQSEQPAAVGCGTSGTARRLIAADDRQPKAELPFAADRPAYGLNVWDLAGLDRANAVIGIEPAIVGLYRDWATDIDFPSGIADRIRQRGAVALISWEPWDSSSGQLSDTRYLPADIAAGAHDGLIDRWADQIRTFGHPIIIRLAPEQNGDWQPWSPGVNGVTTADYVSMWRHVVERFRQRGAENALFMWNPIVAVGESTEMGLTFPGEAYVDYIGLDGFNWGSTRRWGWQSYEDIFASSVGVIERMAPDTEWMIAEVGSAPGDDKAQWVSDLFAAGAANGAAGIVWFEFDKETDWRLSSDPGVAGAARSSVQSLGWATGN